MMLARQVGHAIKQRRKDLKITQPYLAELAHVSVNSLYKLERGQANPTLDLIEKIAGVLGMELTLEAKKATT